MTTHVITKAERDLITNAERCAAELGTPSQHERWCDGLLPENELLALARAELFHPFDGIDRYNVKSDRPSGTIRVIDVRHKPGCAFERGRGEDLDDYTRRLRNYSAIAFDARETTELGALEFEAFKKLTVIASRASQHDWIPAGQGFWVSPREHTATCTTCKASVTKLSATVAVVWAGRTLAREYLVSPSFSRAKNGGK